MERTLNLFYPLLVWLTTVFFGALAPLIINLSVKGFYFDVSIIYTHFLFVFFGLLFSSPAFALFHLLFLVIGEKISSEYTLKTIMALLVLPIGIGTILCFFGREVLNPANRNEFIFCLCYLLSGFLASYVFKAWKKPRPEVDFSFDKA